MDFVKVARGFERLAEELVGALGLVPGERARNLAKRKAALKNATPEHRVKTRDLFRYSFICLDVPAGAAELLADVVYSTGYHGQRFDVARPECAALVKNRHWVARRHRHTGEYERTSSPK